MKREILTHTSYFNWSLLTSIKDGIINTLKLREKTYCLRVRTKGRSKASPEYPASYINEIADGSIRSFDGVEIIDSKWGTLISKNKTKTYTADIRFKAQPGVDFSEIVSLVQRRLFINTRGYVHYVEIA